MELLIAGIAVFAFAGLVLAIVRGVNDARRPEPRTVVNPEGEEWMTVDETAELLDASVTDVMNLVTREAIPHYLLLGGRRARPDDYRFKRDEIDAWTIG